MLAIIPLIGSVHTRSWRQGQWLVSTCRTLSSGASPHLPLEANSHLLMPRAATHAAQVGGALLPQSVQRKNLLWWCPWLTSPQPWCLASLVVPDFFTCTRDCGSPHISGCVHAANPCPLSGCDPEARAAPSSPFPHGGQACQAGGSQVSLHLTLCKPMAVLSSKALKLLLNPNWSPHQQRDFPGCGNLSFIPASSQECKFHPDSLLFISSFVSPSYNFVQPNGDFLAFW